MGEAQERLFWEAVRCRRMLVRAIEDQLGMERDGDKPPDRVPG